MPATTRLAIPYPSSADPPNGPAQMQAIAESLDNAAIDLPEGLIAAIPSPDPRGRWFYATDQGILYRSSGSTWRAVSVAPDAVTAVQIAAAAVGNTELADDSVSKSKMQDNSVGSAEIEADAVGQSELGPGAVGPVEVNDSLKPSAGAAAGTEALRAIGPGGSQVVAGNDPRLALWEPGDLKETAKAVTAGSEPAGWLLCDGRAVSRTTYNALFAAISTAHGAGDGSTTFNLPDYRGRVTVGKGTHGDVDTLGENEGLVVGSRRPRHSHTVNSHSHGGSTGSGGAHGHTGAGNTGAELIDFAEGRLMYVPPGSGGGLQHHHGVLINTDTHGGHGHSIPAETPGTDAQGPAYSVINRLIKT